MRRLYNLLLLAAIALCAAAAHAQVGSFQNWCQAGDQFATTSGLVSVTPMQGSFPVCQITVYATGTTNLSTIYSTVTSTPLANPFCANLDGSFLLFAATSGLYDVTMSNSSACNPASGGYAQLPASFTWRDISMSTTPTAGGGTMTSITTLTPILGCASPCTSTATISFASSGVTPGSYTSTNLTVDTYGRITAAANGSGGGGSGCGSGTNGYFMEFSGTTTCVNAPMQDLGTAGTLSSIPATGSLLVNVGTGGTSGGNLQIGNVPNSSTPFSTYIGTHTFTNSGTSGSAYCYMISSTGTASAFTECQGLGTVISSTLFLHGYNSLTSGTQDWSLGDATGNAIYGIAQGASGNAAGVTITTAASQAFIVKVNGTVTFSVNSTGPSFLGPIGYTPQNYSTLPSCASFVGYTAVVQDSTTNTWGATIAGSGANTVLAFCDGTNWTVAGK